MKRLGPELKKPDMKVPPVLRDLYLDLRDRRLLPLLGLVLVAIVAVPLLLSEDPEEPARTPSAGSTAGAAGKPASSLTVVRSTPGLRDYRRRLRHREPTDPFHQRFTSPVLKGAELGSESSTSESSSESSTEESASAGTSGGSNAVPPSGGAPPPAPGNFTPDGKFKLYTFTMKVQISRTEEDEAGNIKMGEPTTREGVRPLTPLPGEKAPVVTYLGANLQTGKALLMVSKDVTAVFGEAKCVSGTDSCELLEVEKGFPQIFEYGPNQVRYKFNIIKFEVVRAGKT
jgi:hypothetical protein